MRNPLETYEAAKRCYLSNCSAIGSSKATLKNYETSIRLFAEFWQSKYDPDLPASLPSVEDVRDWRDKMLADGSAPSTARQRLSELGFFFTAMSDPAMGDECYFSANPVTPRLYPRVKKHGYGEILTNEQAAMLWVNNCTVKQEKPMWARNYAICVLLLGTGLRNEEVLDLVPADICWEYHEITVQHGKGDKLRIVTMSPIVEAALKLYLASGIRPNSAGDNSPLFGTTAAHKMGAREASEAVEWHRGTSQWLSGLICRHVENITGVQLRTHALRHLFARLSLQTGTPIERVQADLGHSSVSTTEIYTERLTSRRLCRDAQCVFDAQAEWTEKNEQIIRIRGI